MANGSNCSKIPEFSLSCMNQGGCTLFARYAANAGMVVARFATLCSKTQVWICDPIYGKAGSCLDAFFFIMVQRIIVAASFVSC
ncbi:hypothetical protein Nepgr_006474 [Nepenthes gracilis]|uniref:Uncharacterized protein n=1 Tax=Nepenthes gracilis TaxID=150966 RepID=A0AAD3XHD9_NEPGR|nr:hypothetical protein Nepgr_006474 [Nepenthes gracilis]